MIKQTIIFLAGTALLFVSCQSTKVEPVSEVKETVVEKEAEVVEENDDDDVILLDEPADDEYLRSVQDVKEITQEQFVDDKKAILDIITELSEVMDDEDYDTWMKYIEPASLNYYSNPANLRKAQKKLPNKTIQLKNLKDYFKYVFIPSRKRSEVEEIRYISKTTVKAVNVKDDNTVVVYYYFEKIKGRWYVHLPTVK